MNEYSLNILYVCKKCTPVYEKEGKSWYSNTYFMCKELSTKYDVDVYSVIGVLAAISPGIRWDVNIRDTIRLLESYTRQDNLENVNIGVYGARNKTKALRILEGHDPLDVLGGNKVRAFYNCISHIFSNDAPVVVLDRHAVAVCKGYRIGDSYIKYINTNKKYKTVEDSYRYVADRLNMLPHQVQAMVWLYWRDYFKINRG